MVPSLAAVLGFGKDDLDPLGRWNVPVSQRYVRTYRHQVGRIQKAITEGLQGSGPLAELRDETDIEIGLRGWGSKRQIPEDQLEQLIFDLDAYRLETQGVSGGTVTPIDTVSAPPAIEDDPLVPATALDVVAPAEEEVVQDGEPSKEEIAQVLLAEQAVRAEAAKAASDAIPPGTYVLAIRQRTRLKTLHLFGACWRVPGRDYTDFEVLSAVLPDAAKYNQFCNDCFKKKSQPPPFEDVSEASTGSSSSSSEWEFEAENGELE